MQNGFMDWNAIQIQMMGTNFLGLGGREEELLNADEIRKPFTTFHRHTSLLKSWEIICYERGHIDAWSDWSEPKAEHESIWDVNK